MTEKSLLEKGRNGLNFSALLEDFFSSLTENKQILLTFEKLNEEQMEVIDESGHINESMANWWTTKKKIDRKAIAKQMAELEALVDIAESKEEFQSFFEKNTVSNFLIWTIAFIRRKKSYLILTKNFG